VRSYLNSSIFIYSLDANPVINEFLSAHIPD